jgi:transcriptional regulator with XRE-family HTH domain
MMIGLALKTIREQRGMSQSELESLTGLARTNLSRLESGHTVPSLNTLALLAAAYQTTVWKIVKFAEEAKP